MPLKESILPHLDRVDHEARAIGAVNTLHLQGGGWVGYNTDGVGALDAIESHLPVDGKKLLLIGAGGAAQAIAYEALRRGARLVVVNRHSERARQIAARFGGEARCWEELPLCAQEGYDLLIHCTPAELPIDPMLFLPGAWVMDIRMRGGVLLDRAAERGCRIIYGHEMFVAQALGQFRIWWGSDFPLRKARALLENSINNQLYAHM